MLAVEVDVPTSKSLLSAANEVLLFFFRVDKVDRARLSALKYASRRQNFSARSCSLHSSISTPTYRQEECEERSPLYYSIKPYSIDRRQSNPKTEEGVF